MPRKTDTREKVFEAADQLLSEGLRPTQQSIRDRIGTGSISTINKALNDWWRTVGERLNQDSSRPELPDQVIDAASRMWQQSLAYAERALSDKASQIEARTEQIRQEAASRVEEMSLELSQLRDQNARLLQDNERLSREKLTAQSETLSHEERIIRLLAEKESLEREIKQQSLLGSDHASGSRVLDNEFMDLKVSLGIAEQETQRLLKQVARLSDENAQLRRESSDSERQATARIHELEKTIARQEIWIEQLREGAVGNSVGSMS